jgi:hypothetical protein
MGLARAVGPWLLACGEVLADADACSITTYVI